MTQTGIEPQSSRPLANTLLIRPIQFSINTQFSSIWPIDRTLSGASTPGQSGPGSDSYKGVLHISQSSSITEASSSDCLVSYLGNSLRESYSSAEKQSVYSAAPANWANRFKAKASLLLSQSTPAVTCNTTRLCFPSHHGIHRSRISLFVQSFVVFTTLQWSIN